MKKLNVFVLVVVLFIGFSSCVIEVKETKTKPMPPPHAPAHGVRAKYHYRFYPSLNIYYDINRGIYFYLESGVWKSSNVLPGHISINLYDYVVIDLDTDTPYKYYKKHKNKYHPNKNKPPKKPKK